MPKCYQLIGVPASGKSTWYKNQDWLVEDKKDHKYVSTDQHVEGYALDQGKTYSEVFDEYMPTAVKQMMVNVNFAAALKIDIVWDQTSTTIASRARKFNALPEYEHIAVVFRTPDRSELDVRLSGRPGKHIPKNVIDSMIAGWEEPSLEEGFKEIWYAV
jgi:predicted kinase